LRGTILSIEVSPRSSEAGISAPDGVTFLHETDALGRTHATFLKDGKQIGSAVIREFAHSIQITNFQVARGARRKGIGTAFQSYIEAQLGKRSVPDGMLSKAEYRRWKKVDPVAVRDYVKGTKTYTPRSGSAAFFAALGGPPVPGSRASQDRSTQAGLLMQKPTKSRRKRSTRQSHHSHQVAAN
jgi:GNAT superfamily N-acetyltransferase